MKTAMKTVLRSPAPWGPRVEAQRPAGTGLRARTTPWWARRVAQVGAWLEAWPVLPQHDHGGWYV